MSTPTTSTGRTTGQAAPPRAETVNAFNWRRYSECGPKDADVFFPEKGMDEDYANGQAKEICGRCPVRDLCLAEALESREPFGVRGGLTSKEREQLLGRARLPARGHQGNPEPMWRQILRVDERRERLLDLHARGWSAGRIAGALHTNVQTINRVMREMNDQAALDAASEAVAA